MRFAKDNALMLEATKSRKVKLPGGGLHEVDGEGNKFWYNDRGEVHRLDGPAIEWPDGSKGWYVNGIRHRLDGPAGEYANGTKIWCVDGKLHRVDGPAIERVDGSSAWWVNGVRYTEEEFNRLFGKYKDLEDRQVIVDMEGMFEATKSEKAPEVDILGNEFWYNDKGQLHRLDGPAVHRKDGYEAWYVNGQLHRLDGPAVVRADGSKAWYVNGQLHRVDGPAFERADGTGAWYIDGKKYSEEEFNKFFGKYKDVADRQVVVDMEGMFE